MRVYPCGVIGQHTCPYCGAPVRGHYKGVCPNCPKPTPLEHATLLRDLDVKVSSMRNLVALARNARLKPAELNDKLRAEWLRVASDLRRLVE